MSYLDDWKAQLSTALEARGARSELARWLESSIGSTFERWKVQIAKVLNAGATPDGEFVLAVNDWLSQQNQCGGGLSAAKKRPKQKRRR